MPCNMLGLKNVPGTGFYKGKDGTSLPNEVSDSAGTRRFHYHYMSDQHSQSSFHTVHLGVGIRSLDEVLDDIRVAVERNGHPPDAFDLLTDADGYILLQIKRPGFQVVFNANQSIGNYLGFEDGRNFPCNPFEDVCEASEVVDAGCVNATNKTTLWCAVTQGNTIFQKRSDTLRLLASKNHVSGQKTCTRQDGRTGKCACAAKASSTEQARCTVSEDDRVARINGSAPADVSTSECQCEWQEDYEWQETGDRPWGIFNQHIVTFDDGIYDLNALNHAVNVTLSAQGIDARSLRFDDEEAPFVRMKLRTDSGFLPVPGSRLQVDFNASTISELLGFRPFAQPPGYTDTAFEVLADSNSSVVMGVAHAETANNTGEWVFNVAAGHQHTLVQTCRGGDRAIGNICSNTRLWALGSNKYGQLGTDYNFGTDYPNPIPVLLGAAGSNFDPYNARSIHAGGSHSAVVDVDGKIWTFGDNSYQQCGDSSIQLNAAGVAAWQPRRLKEEAFGVGRLRNVTLALGHHHTLVRALDSNMTGIIWTFGRNQFGQLAKPLVSDLGLGLPQRVELPALASESFTNIFCAGGNHSMFVTADGKVWGVGRNRFGQLGIDDVEDVDNDEEDKYVDAPLPVGWIKGPSFWQDPFDGRQINTVRCGNDHTAIISGNYLTLLGSNTFGQLLSEDNAGSDNPSGLWPDLISRLDPCVNDACPLAPSLVDDNLFLGDSKAVSAQPVIQVWLSGDATFVQTLRQPCTPGHAAPDGHQPCFKCASGKYEPEHMSRGCTSCPLGHYSEEGQTRCTECPAGKYANQTGMGECVRCPQARPGTFDTGAMTLDNCTKFCDSGFFGTSGTPPCSICGKGSYSISSLSGGAEICTLCSRGTYQPNEGSSRCFDCPTINSTHFYRTVGDGAQSLNECLLVCLPGTYGANGLEPCKPCSPGSVAPSADMAQCDICGKGTYMNASGQTSCLPCPPGKGTAGPNKTDILDCIPLCQPGQYSEEGVVPCQQCAAGEYSSGYGQMQCLPCGPGNFSIAGQRICERCPAGSFVAGTGNTGCELCKAGQYQKLQGQTQCKACPTGTYQNRSGMSSCIECPGDLSTRPPEGNMGANASRECQRFCRPGTFSVDGLLPFGADECTVCQNGTSTTQAVNGTEMEGATTCLDCLPGSYAPKGAPICLRCPAGTSSGLKADQCDPCPPGYSSNVGATACFACPAGSFSNGVGRPNCSACSPGTYQSKTNSTFCESCEPGFYILLPGQRGPCRSCTYGKYSNQFGASFCQSCDPGYDARHEGLAACRPCPNGTYAHAQGTKECRECEIGKYADSITSTQCEPCQPGSVSVAGSSTCSACVPGTFSSGAASVCSSCPTGKYTRSVQADKVEKCVYICRAGEFGDQGMSRLYNESCKLCPAAYFSVLDFSTSCTECPAGKFSASVGSSRCTNCSAGFYAVGRNLSCAECSAGTFAAFEGSSVCLQCAPGRFAMSPASTICEQCPLGTYQDLAGTSICKQCAFGTSTPSMEATASSECLQYCPPGTFSPENGVEKGSNGVSSCLPCAPGSYNPFLKMTACLFCPPGKFEASTRSTACKECGVNTFSDRANTSSCQPCGPNPLGEETYTIDTSGLPYWVARGAQKQLQCLEIDVPCGENPRNLSVYPVYNGGRHDYGQTTSPNMVETTRADYGPTGYEIRQSIVACKALGGEEVSRIRTGGFHTIFETMKIDSTPNLLGALNVRRRLLAFGLNSHGQLGSPKNAGTENKNEVPIPISMNLFSSSNSAGEISEQIGNNVFVYWRFDPERETRVQFNFSIPDGFYSPLQLAQYVSSEANRLFGHPENIFIMSPEGGEELPRFMVARPGFQADFTQDRSPGRMFGTLGIKVPPNGTLNEISAASGNNVFAYRYWCGTALEGLCNESRTVRVTVPDGIYTHDSLEPLIETATLHNGDDQSRFEVSFTDGRVKIQVDERFQIAFDVPNSVAEFLGFDDAAVPADGPADSQLMSIEAQSIRPWLFADGTHQTAFPAPVLPPQQMISEFRLGAFHSLVQTWEPTDEPGRNGTISRLWAFGSNLMGQLGVESNAGTNLPNHVPLAIPLFDEMRPGGRRAVNFKVSADHSMVMDSQGLLWLFGSNQYGQLGISGNSGSQNPNWSPIQFEVTKHHTNSWVQDFALGDQHSVVMSFDKLGVEKLWLFGSNEKGQLGHSASAGLCKDPANLTRTAQCKDVDPRIPVAFWEPKAITPVSLDNKRIKLLSVGGFHNLIVTDDGRLWCFGSNEFGQCGIEEVDSRGGDAAGSSNPGVIAQPLLVGSVQLTTEVEQPPAECCTPNTPADGQKCLVSNRWEDKDGLIQTCPFNKEDVQIIETGKYHTIVVSGDPPPRGYQTYWSFGLNSYGQLFRQSANLGTGMVNSGEGEDTSGIARIPATNFGYGKQVRVDQIAGGFQSFIKTARLHCEPGNHSIDKREPCEMCEPGSFTPHYGTLTSSSYSFDQSVMHPYTSLIQLTYISAQRMSCQPCAAGRFAPYASQSSCEICDVGTYSFPGASTCHNCAAGTFANFTQSANCTLCATGFSSNEGSKLCYPCPPGKYADQEGMPSCEGCPAGKYNDQSGSSMCYECAVDFYQEDVGQTACTECPPEKRATAGPGSTSIEDCLNLCSPGEFGAPLEPQNSGSLAVQPCEPCEPGYFAADRGMTSCQACAAGYYTFHNASSFCSACPGGKFSPPASTACTVCPPGTFSLTNASACTECLEGKFSLGGGNVTACTNCPAGDYQNSTGRTFCLTCALGTYSPAGASTCFLCAPGAFSLSGSSVCTNCTAGYFSAESGMSFCESCLPGSYSELAASTCIDCSPGSRAYGPIAGYAATSCELCVTGKFSGENATANCSFCPAGSFGDSPGMSVCDLCVPGYHSPSRGFTVCTTCIPGTFSLLNFTTCLNCSQGTYNNLYAQQNCSECSAGYYGPRTGLTVCTACAGGTYGNVTGLSACYDCKPGNVSTMNATVCSACIPGTIASTSRMTACTLCSVGQFNTEFQGTACEQCPSNLTTQGEGAGEDGRPYAVPEWFNAPERCVPACSVGKFSIWGVRPIYDVCTDCPAGYYGPNPGATSCVACSGGNFSRAGMSSCLTCDPGTYAKVASSHCTDCEAGKFAFDSGRSACTSCPQKMFSSASGQTTCEHCPTRIDASMNMLYYTDCRSSCSSQDLANAAGSPPTCCMGLPHTSIALTTATYTLKELEAEMNNRIFNVSGMNSLVRLGMNDLAVSRGLSVNYTTIELHIQFGGFIFHLYDPENLPDSCQFHPLNVFDVDPRDAYCKEDSKNIGAILGFSAAVPSLSATQCLNPDEDPDMDGGCYSSFSRRAPQLPYTLITKFEGETSSAACEAFCEKGTYSADGIQKFGQKCSICNSGNFSDELGSTACKQCAPGSYSDSVRPYLQCTQCEHGKSQPLAANTSCTFCGVGVFSPFRGLSTCRNCQPGTYSLTTGAASSFGAAHAFSRLTASNNASSDVNALPDTCLECPPGEVSSSEASTSCVPCSPGFVATGAGLSACTHCHPGHFSNQIGASICEGCAPGSRSEFPSSSTACVLCVAGTAAPGQTSICTDCVPGKYSGPTAPVCIDCAPGFHSENFNSPYCDSCLPGKISVGNQQYCSSCEPGKYSNVTNSSACISCSAGSFAKESGSSFCALCDFGSWSQGSASFCHQCPEGKNSTGMAETSVGACRPKCPKAYSGFNGVEPCFRCEPGGVGNIKGTMCREESRVLGHWTDTGLDQVYVVDGKCLNNTCPLCEAGTFSPRWGMSTCMECAQHYYSYAGQANCTACPGATVTTGTGSSSVQDCEARCTPGSYSLDGLAPCEVCSPGYYGQQYGMTSCLGCAAGKFQPRELSTSCFFCPPGKGTFLPARQHMMSCRGIAPKYMYQEESLHPECALDYSITKDEGMLDNVYINENGEGYIDGFVAMIGGQGSSFEGRAEVSSSGSIAKTVVVNAGDSYTSGQMKIFYSVPSAAAPQVEQPLIRSDKVMTGTISRVFDYPFLDLMSTPHSVLVGCESGHVEVDSSSGGNGFRAEYSVKKFGHMFEKLCIGVLDPQTGACDPRLDNHGANYTSRPRVRLVETSIQVVRIKSGPGASIRGCNVTNATLQAYGGGLQSRGFRATYSVLGGGSIDEIKIESAGRGYETEPSIYPTDPACMCGSGIGEVSIVSAGSGYRGTYSNDTAGFFVVGPNSRPNPGAGFKAIFGTGVSGQLMNIRIVDAGDGYAGDEVELVACPVACCALFDETCCLAISSGASCKNGILEAEVRAEVGFRGGVAGKNFDRCLEPVIDRSSCRCGSGVAEIEVVDAGSGYINGVLAVSESLPSACYDPCLVAVSANDTKSRNATNTTNSINATNQTNATSNNQPAVECLPWKRPHYCNISGEGFAATFHVLPVHGNDTERRKLSGPISGAKIVTMGRGYNSSHLSIQILYPGAVRCDNGTGNFSTSCEQSNTISEVLVQGKSTFTLPKYYSLLRNESYCWSSCNEAQNCTGSGFSARLVFGKTMRVSGSFEPWIDMSTITGANITNHGTGYDPSSPPRIECTLNAVFNIPLAAPVPPCFANGKNGSNATLINCTTNVSNIGAVQNFTNTSNLTQTITIPGPWDLFNRKIVIHLQDLTWASGNQTLLPVVAGGAQLEMGVGRPSGQFNNSDTCVGTTWANNALLAAGPLVAMEVRLFGFFLTADQTHFDRIVLDEGSINNERLFFFMKAAFGRESIQLDDCVCHLQKDVRSNVFDELDVHRGIECMCVSELWGLQANMSMFLIESFRNTSSNLNYPAQVQVDLAFLKVATNFSGVWKPFGTEGLPLFGDLPSNSWLHSIGFGREPFSSSTLNLYVQASTTSFKYSSCAVCELLPTSDQFRREGLMHAIFSKGLQLKGSLAHMVSRPDGTFRLLGLERFVPSIHEGAALLTVEANLAIMDCLWPETQRTEWRLTFNGTIPFYPPCSMQVAENMVGTLTGIGEYEDVYLDIPMTLFLRENRPFDISSRMIFFKEHATQDMIPLVIFANTSEWKVAFRLPWLLFNDVDFVIEGVQAGDITGINITSLIFNGTGSATFFNDPWTSGGQRAEVAIDFRGTSSRQFPHVSTEISAHLTTPDPAAVVRTLTQQALGLNYTNPTCGTTACQDLLFEKDKIHMILSTWDSENVGTEVPSRDARSYSCVTTNGNVASGTPCHFPFEYNGQIFYECTSQDWHVPWCSTTAVYYQSWGECVCDKLRRGVQLKGQVRLHETGPMLTQNAGGVEHLLQPLHGGLDREGLNASLSMYFPIFDSDEPNDLELLVSFVPSRKSLCMGGNNSNAVPTVGKAPSGECERLGYITEWLGEAGDESMVVCRPPHQVFPDGMNVHLAAAATQAMQGRETAAVDPYVSVSSPVDEAQACTDMGLMRELSLCTAEKFRNIPVAAPALFGHQFCFWTDTSKNAGLEENKFAQCAVCHGPSCTSNHEPLRAWQIEDVMCYSYPCGSAADPDEEEDEPVCK